MMQFLEAVRRSPEVSWYRLRGDFEGKVTRWVASTPETVAICNSSDLIGVDFSRRLSRAMSSMVEVAPFRAFLESGRSQELCIVNFLRGGLNFDLRNVLHNALGSNHHATCFMSSQRYREDGRWLVKEDMYRKLQIPDNAILLIGDVVATGVTAANGLEVIEQEMVASGVKPRGLVFFTIGCHKVEKILEDLHTRFSDRFPSYQETHVVYLEGKFRLVDSSTPVVIGIPGTDLIKLEALISPELALSQYASITAPLERCVIYDAGSRTFDVREYLGDVIEYWEQVNRLARRGYTLAEGLSERWPEYGGSDGLVQSVRERWRNVPDELFEQLHDLASTRWTPEFEKWAKTSEALEQVSSERLERLKTVLL